MSKSNLNSRQRLNAYPSPALNLIPFPYGFGGTDNLAQEGPDSLLASGELSENLQALGIEVNTITLTELGPFQIQEDFFRIRNIDAITSVNRWLKSQVCASLTQNNIPISLGGDASLSVASVQALNELDPAKNYGVLWFNNHLANSSPEVTKSWNANRMVYSLLTKNSLETEHADLSQLIGSQKLPLCKSENIVRIGINHRSAQDYCDNNYYSMEDIDQLGIQEILKLALEDLKDCREIHLIVDLNVFDLSGVSNYSLGQLSYREALQAARFLDMELRRKDKLSSLDIVEHCPSREAWDKRGEAAEWVSDFVSTLFGGHIFNTARKY
jgi:arginase family enzyme